MKSKYFIYNSVLVLGLLLLFQTAMAGILQPFSSVDSSANNGPEEDILPTIRAELVQDISTSSQRGSVYLIGATARFEVYPVDPDEEFGLIDEYAAYVDGEEVYRRTSFRGTGKYPPYAFSKHLSSVGSYEIKFSATDNEGNTVFTPTFTLQALNYVDFNCEGTSQGCITVRNMPDRNGSSSNAPMTNTPPLISTTGGSINSPVAVSLLAKLVRQNAALQTQVEQAANQSFSQIQRAQSFAAPTYVIRQKLIRIAGESTNPAHTKEILSIVSELAALEA